MTSTILLLFAQAKKTPLHLAAQHGKWEVCNTLLKLKADANAVDEVGAIVSKVLCLYNLFGINLNSFLSV